MIAVYCILGYIAFLVLWQIGVQTSENASRRRRPS